MDLKTKLLKVIKTIIVVGLISGVLGAFSILLFYSTSGPLVLIAWIYIIFGGSLASSIIVLISTNDSLIGKIVYSIISFILTLILALIAFFMTSLAVKALMPEIF